MTPPVHARGRGRRRVAGFLLAAGALLGGGAADPAFADTRPTLAPDESLSVASQAAGWLAGSQLSPEGALYDQAGQPGQPNPVSTAYASLALQANGLHVESDTPTRWLEQHVENLARQDGADSPAGLALLVLVARAQDLPPESFGGTDLLARLEATRRPDGLFGVEASGLGSYDPAGGAPARQGLVLAALGAAGRTDAGAADWLEARQCPSGGWQYGRTDLVSTCRATPETTGYAMMGLAAIGRDVPREAVRSLARIQRPDGGFATFGGASDAFATATALQGLIAAGVDPNTPRWRKAQGTTPFQALLHFDTSPTGGFSLVPMAPPDPGLTARVAIAAAGQPLPLAAPVTGNDTLGSDANGTDGTDSSGDGSGGNGSSSTDGSSSRNSAESGGTTTGSAGFSAVPLLAVGAGSLVVVAGIYAFRRRRQAL